MNQTTEVLNKFTQNELQALIASINGTIRGLEKDETAKRAAWHFSDYCQMEGVEAAQFADDSLEELEKSVNQKLSDLSNEEVHALYDYLYGFWKQAGEGDIDLDKYTSKEYISLMA